MKYLSLRRLTIENHPSEENIPIECLSKSHNDGRTSFFEYNHSSNTLRRF